MRCGISTKLELTFRETEGMLQKKADKPHFYYGEINTTDPYRYIGMAARRRIKGKSQVGRRGDSNR